MAGRGTDGRWWAPLLVGLATLAVPLGLLAWLVWSVVPAPTSPAPEPEYDELVLAASSRDDPTPVPPVEVIVPVAAAPPAPPPPPVVIPAPPPVVPSVVWGREPAFNFVAVGVDRRQDREIPRTDTIIIGSVDLLSHRLNLVSIPRDLLVEIPGYGHDRINAAYVHGEQFGEPGGGIGLLRRTIERSFGVPIQHFGEIDFACFRAAVDAVGGVTVDVPRAILDTQYPTEDYGYKTVSFEMGPQRLDGERALEYARTRYADNDFGRIRRQQQIVAALRHELLQLRALPALPRIISGCRNMRSDLGFREYLTLANTLRGLGGGHVTMRVIDEGMAVETITAGGAAVLLPRWEPIRALLRASFPIASANSELGQPRARVSGPRTSN